MKSFSYGNDRYLSGEAADTLSSAVKRDDIAAMIDLLDRGHSLDRKVEAGYTPLMIATGLGNSQLVQLLLDRGADVHILDTNMGASALHKAAQSGVIDVAKLLIEHGAFVDLQSPTLGHTPLIDAVWHKRTAMVRYLLAQGARTELRTHYGATALEFAHRDQLTEIARLLEEHTATVAGKVQSQALMRAVLRRRTEDVRRHIAEGSAVDEPAQLVGSPNDGYTPLHAAARDGQTEIVRILIEAGADVCLADGLMKATPGHKAAYQGHAEAARILIALGELDAQGPYNGFTPLHDAVWHGHAETVSVLLEAGARLDIRSHTGATPVDLALEYGYQDVAAMLQRQAASPVSEGEPARPSDTRKLG